MISGHGILSVELFVAYCEERGVGTSEAELELFHSNGWLRPVAFAGTEDEISEILTDARRLWCDRPDELKYEPWSNLKGDYGRFARPPWYATAQIYLLRCLKSAFLFRLNLDEYDGLVIGSRKAQTELAEAIRHDVGSSLADIQSQMPKWQRLVFLLTEAYQLRDDFLDDAARGGESRVSWATQVDDARNCVLDYLSSIRFFFQEHAKVFVQKFDVTADELKWCHNRLSGQFTATIGMLNPVLFLRHLPSSAAYQSAGPMRLGMDMLRDMSVLAAIAEVGHGVRLFSFLGKCSECGKELPNLGKPGRPATICGEDDCIRALRARQQRKRRGQARH